MRIHERSLLRDLGFIGRGLLLGRPIWRRIAEVIVRERPAVPTARVGQIHRTDDVRVRLGCERYGTTIDFVRNPPEAARLAKAEDKLTLVLHVSGNFEDDAFT